MRKDGYFGEHDDDLRHVALQLRENIQTLVSERIPPVFIWVFDETWAAFRRLSPVIAHFLGADYKIMPNMWAWHVDPKRAESGWAAHRDRDRSALAPDGSPLSLTCWIPLTDATPLNSCMHVVPAHLDPAYADPNGPMPSPFSIRALPAKPGDYFIWNQVVLHWGGPTSEFGETPRMSIALEFQRGDISPFTSPLIAPEQAPAFDERLQLIARQVLQYRHMYDFAPEIADLATKVLSGDPSD